MTRLLGSSDRRLFFFHLPKAGGTAVGRVLESMVPAEQRCPLIENTERDHERRRGRYAAFAGYRYYGGHYGHDIFTAVADGHYPVSTFREPARRLLSLYNYYRLNVTLPRDLAQLDDLYPVALAQRVDFHRFVSIDDPRIEIHTRNFHVRQLTSSAWDPASIGDLAHAVGLVDAMPWFYVAEQPARSERWGRRIFGKDFGTIGRENVTLMASGEQTAVGDIDSATMRVIGEKNKLDTRLHAYASRRLAVRVDGIRRLLPWA